MGKRQILLWTLILVGLGTLVWGVLSLHRVFVDERAAAEQAVALTRRDLASHARAAFLQHLRAQLAAATGRIAAARDDCLVPSSGLLFIDEGQQVLPRLVRFRAGDHTPAQELYVSVRAGTPPASDEPDGPSAERLALLTTLEAAIARDDRTAITDSARRLLNHHIHYVIAAEFDLPLRIRFVEELVAVTDTDPAVVAGLLRDGLRAGDGRRLVGLQPLLIESQDRLTAPDFRFLADRVIELSRQAGIPFDDFATAAADSPRPALAVPTTHTTATIFAQQWYIEVLAGGMARGVLYDSAHVLAAIEAEMRVDLRLDDGDRLGWLRPLRDVEAAVEIPLDIQSPRWDTQLTAIGRRYRMKTALAAIVLGLAAAIVVLSRVLVWRERRYLQSRSQFVAAVSHELRTPLAGVRVMAETLERHRTETAEVREFAGRIVRQADRLTFLVDNILSFNRLDRDSMAGNFCEVDLAEIIDELREQSAAFTTKEVNIHLHGDTDLRRIADLDLVRLLLSNLISNSCRYNERSPIEIDIEVACGLPFVMRVRDNGVGIPQAMWQRVFVEFFRVPAIEGKAAGFGLGLAICRRIMALHRGRIDIVESGSNGTTFELRFGVTAKQGSAR